MDQYPMDPNYSEIDFEYLPNGGLGQNTHTLYFTSWETYQAEPWIQDSLSFASATDQAGCKQLVVQIDGSEMRYYLDGELQTVQGGEYYPETPMSINFNLWFINNGLVDSFTPRAYEQNIDWMLFVKDEILTPQQIGNKVEQLRTEKRTYLNTTR